MRGLVISDRPPLLAPELLAGGIVDGDKAVGGGRLGLVDGAGPGADDLTLDLAGNGDPAVIGDGHGQA